MRRKTALVVVTALSLLTAACGKSTTGTNTVRDGVTWSDGQPFSADDVVFTFNLMKQTPAVDLYSLWSGAGLQSVSASGNQVTLAFNAVATPYFYNFADQVGIVPKHIFSTGDAAAHPDTWEDKAP